jgi:hypothetical protein
LSVAVNWRDLRAHRHLSTEERVQRLVTITLIAGGAGLVAAVTAGAQRYGDRVAGMAVNYPRVWWVCMAIVVVGLVVNLVPAMVDRRRGLREPLVVNSLGYWGTRRAQRRGGDLRGAP